MKHKNMLSESSISFADHSLNDGKIIEEQPKVVVVAVPLPSQGHLNQLLHLSHLVSSYDIPVYFVGSSTHNHQAKARLNGWSHHDKNSKIQFHDLQLPALDPTPPPSNSNFSSSFPTDRLQHLLEVSTQNLREPVYHLLQELSLKFSKVIVIHDILTSYVVQDVKLIPNAEAYTFIPMSAFTMFFDCSTAIPQEFRPFHIKDDLVIPEFECDLFEECMTDEMWDFAVSQVKLLGFESGWLYNSSRVIESRYIELLETLKTDVKHFALGPLQPVARATDFKSKHQSLEWLDKQEKGSVIYVSFGSTTSLTHDQIHELAHGLDKCGQNFIWVLRKADNPTQDDKKLEPQLPQGYEEKVKNKGIVVRDWGPQLELLTHSSVGGFMSHCGWNSCIESLSMGVPIVAWPMHSDQPRNAYLVSDVLRVGLMVRDWAHRREVVTSDSIENAVRRLMVSKEGMEMKERATRLGEDIRGSVAQGGVSCVERNTFIAHFTKNV